MTGYIARRLAATGLVIVMVSVVTFATIHLVPGNPAAVMLGSSATTGAIRSLSQAMGLNKPLVVQFLIWVRGVLAGHLGYSYFLDQPVGTALIQHVGPTVALTLGAEIVSVTSALIFGLWAAWNRGTLFDRLFDAIAMILVSVPDFVLGLEFIYLFAVLVRIFPVSGYHPTTDGWGPFLRSIALPSIVLGLGQAGLLARMVRDSVVGALDQNYARVAMAKGVSTFGVIVRHAFRSSLMVPLTVLGSGFATLLGGVVILESIFNIPGLGWLAVHSILNKDYPTVQAVVLFVATAYVFINLAVDLLYLWVDPRTRMVYQ